MLLDLHGVAPEDGREPLRRQLRLLDEVAERSLAAGDLEHAKTPDPQGLGTARA